MVSCARLRRVFWDILLMSYGSGIKYLLGQGYQTNRLGVEGRGVEGTQKLVRRCVLPSPFDWNSIEYSGSSGKQTPSEREKVVRKFSWPLTSLVFWSFVATWGVRVRWPLRGTWSATNKNWDCKSFFVSVWPYFFSNLSIRLSCQGGIQGFSWEGYTTKGWWNWLVT